ncbi:MAG: hypothetical protein KGQ60_11295, partial [Planctomycetes bacterium]|nr:hypothetical protein [Planctomycetota bacterium]
SWLYIVRWRSPAEYVGAGTGDEYRQLVQYLRSNHAGNRILLLFEHRLAYLPAGAEIATPYFQTKYLIDEENPTRTAVDQQWRDLGIDLLVITNRPLGPDVSTRWLEKQQAMVENIQPLIDDSRLKTIYRTADYSVLRLEK